jgi:hypothetical protein
MARRPKVTQVVNEAGEILMVGDRVRSISSTMWPASEISPSTGRITSIGYKYVSVWTDEGKPLLFSVRQVENGTWKAYRLVKLTK